MFNNICWVKKSMSSGSRYAQKWTRLPSENESDEENHLLSQGQNTDGISMFKRWEKRADGPEEKMQRGQRKPEEE